MVTMKNKDLDRKISWDAENRITKTVDNSIATDYTYDDQGSRVIKKGQYGEVLYVNSNYALRNGAIESKQIFAGNTRVATKMANKGTDQGTYYYHGDHLASSNSVTTRTGSVHEYLDYFPYGETWVQEKASETATSMPYKFTSKELDPETGLYYFGARYLDPRLSRWVSADDRFDKLYKTTGLDLYGYVHANPVRYTDPTGHETSGAGIFGDIGFVIGTGLNIQVLSDDDGNYGFSISYSKAVSAPNASLHVGIERTSADTIYDTSGSSVSFTFGGGEGLTGAVEYSNLKGSGHGIKVSAGAGVGTPVGGSASLNETAVGGVNVKTIRDDVLQVGKNIKGILKGDKKLDTVFDDVKNPFGYSSGNGSSGWANENKGNNDSKSFNKSIEKKVDNLIKSVDRKVDAIKNFFKK